MPVRPNRVLIVGGGAGGVITAAALVRRATHDSPTDVHVLERGPVVGPGLAYDPPDEMLLLNNYAGRMSALVDDPDDLLRWCAGDGIDAGPDTFLPRTVYGRYLAQLLDRLPAPRGSRVTRLRGEAVDLEETASGYQVSTSCGWRLEADVVVLALGNPRPRLLSWMRLDPAVVSEDPLDPSMVERIPDSGRVLLVGTGLTMVDVAAQIAASHPHAHLTAVSRHGLLPLRHLNVDRGPAPPYAGKREVRRVAAHLRRAATDGRDWRGEMEAVKAAGNELWSSLEPMDRERFVRHFARYWEVARHRMAPAMAAIVDQLVATRRLTIARPADVDPAGFDHVVNCTGPAPACTSGWNPLVDSLAARRMVRPGPLGLGLDVDPAGRPVDATGIPGHRIFAVGAARRGAEWEVGSVPDLRRQAARIAEEMRAPALDGVAG